jgi:hypothetical protein
MELRVVPCDATGEGLYYVVDVSAGGEQPVVLFAASSWAEAECYIADLGGG